MRNHSEDEGRPPKSAEGQARGFRCVRLQASTLSTAELRQNVCVPPSICERPAPMWSHVDMGPLRKPLTFNKVLGDVWL